MTLVELLVVMALFAITSSLTIFDYGSFRNSVSTQNLADDIALSIRKAQSYAIGSHDTGTSFSSHYGVHFTTNQNPTSALGGSSKAFVMFIDNDGSGYYNIPLSGTCGTSNECNEVLSIKSDDRISSIYLNGNLTPIASTDSIDVRFVRPNPDAIFCYRISDGVCDISSKNISHIVINVSNSTTNKSKIITIWNTGQISIQ
jgi:type II secretory pathway pseudopilin PulG